MPTVFRPAFTVVTTWATSPEEFRKSASECWRATVNRRNMDGARTYPGVEVSWCAADLRLSDSVSGNSYASEVSFCVLVRGSRLISLPHFRFFALVSFQHGGLALCVLR